MKWCRPLIELKLAAPAGFGMVEAPLPWSTIMERLDKGFRDLLIRYQNGLPPEQFFAKFDELLFQAHSEAHYAGQFDAGGFASRGLARHIGRAMADEESYWLRGFVMDLMDGRYTQEDGDLKTAQILNRMGLYQGKVRGSASRGFVDGSKIEDQFIWVLGGKEHCSTCPQLAAASAEVPFTRNTLSQYPGDGSTECLGNCKCHLVRVRDGSESQRPS